VNSVI
jgi:hypothetical protein